MNTASMVRTMIRGDGSTFSLCRSTETERDVYLSLCLCLVLNLHAHVLHGSRYPASDPFQLSHGKSGVDRIAWTTRYARHATSRTRWRALQKAVIILINHTHNFIIMQKNSIYRQKN